jgi:hypothetical protein
MLLEFVELPVLLDTPFQFRCEPAPDGHLGRCYVHKGSLFLLSFPDPAATLVNEISIRPDSLLNFDEMLRRRHEASFTLEQEILAPFFECRVYKFGRKNFTERLARPPLAARHAMRVFRGF